MSNLTEIYVKKETLATILKTLEAKGENGIKITLSTNEECDKFGNNVNAYISQSKEQREAKANKFYVGNGKVFWTNGVVKVAEKKEAGAVYNAEPILPKSTPEYFAF